MHGAAGALLTAGSLLVAGCGGGERQDAHETSRSFAVQLVRASFPARQRVSKPSTLEIQVRNSGTRTMPTVAVALNSLLYIEKFPNLAANQRPFWVIERGPGPVAKPPVNTEEVSKPGGGQTAYVNIWALGPLAPGATRTFRWQLMPVKPGKHTVDYAVFAGLAGKAKTRLESGGAAQGRFEVTVERAPALKHVEPSTGRIAVGRYPASP
jgi:hypothetical protein